MDMALVRCPECAREISDRAAACPGCGVPTNPLSRAEPEPPPQTTVANIEVVNSTEAAKVERGGWTYDWPFHFFQKHWNGEYSLARSYWINTLLISLFAPGLGLVLFPLVSDRPAKFASAAGAARLPSSDMPPGSGPCEAPGFRRPSTRPRAASGVEPPRG